MQPIAGAQGQNASAITVVQVGNAPTRVATFGSGPPLVLVHGLAGSSAWWVRNVEALSGRHTVYLVDLPGFGSMRKYAKLFSVRTAAKWLAEVISALHLRRTAVIGHSMGGLIAAMFAAHFPDQVEALVLAAPAISLAHKSVLPFLIPLAKEARYMHPAFLPMLMRDTMRAGLITLLRASRELLAVDMHHELSMVQARSLLIFGQRDSLVPVSLARELQTRIEHSEVLVFPSAGHVLMYDRADLFNDAVLRFLAEPAKRTLENK